MTNNIEGVRELDALELDQVGGGLSLGPGLNLDLSSELGAVSGVIDQVGLWRREATSARRAAAQTS